MREDFGHEYEREMSRDETERLLERLREHHPEMERHDGWESMDRRPQRKEPEPEPERVRASEPTAAAIDDMRSAIAVVMQRRRLLPVIAHIADKHDVAADIILSPSRRRSAVLARQEAITYVHDVTGIGPASLGRLFHRDHSTVLHSIRKHREREADRGA